VIAYHERRVVVGVAPAPARDVWGRPASGPRPV